MAGQPWPGSASGIVPGDPGRAFANRTGTVPGAYNPDELRAYNYVARERLVWMLPADAPTWAGPVSADLVARAIWQPTVFDLRPDLRDSTGAGATACIPIGRSATFGVGAGCSVHIEGVDTATVDIECYWMERAHPRSPELVQIIANRVDVTPDFWNFNPDIGAVELYAIPPGQPNRFWQPIYVFDQMSGVFPDNSPLIFVSAFTS